MIEETKVYIIIHCENIQWAWVSEYNNNKKQRPWHSSAYYITPEHTLYEAYDILAELFCHIIVHHTMDEFCLVFRRNVHVHFHFSDTQFILYTVSSKQCPLICVSLFRSNKNQIERSTKKV